jgi:bla regulator protein BlaR1
MIPELLHQGWTVALANHLWQSTITVALAWLLTLCLRRNQARVRYWVWMAASVKFLVPFSLLISAGEGLKSFFTTSVAVKPSLVSLVQQIEQPLPQVEYFSTASPELHGHGMEWLVLPLVALWLGGALMISVCWLHAWLRFQAALRNASPLELTLEVPVFSTNEQIEPGIFGVFSPVLLLPHGLLTRLSPAQLEAIFDHEMCHVRHRDNLTFAVHMVVEALFWFHPAVWWIGTRLINEREQACDEAVTKTGGSPETYAEGILNVCRYCVESPLACASGVSGADLKDRIVRIMSNKMTHKLDAGRKALLGAAAIFALAMPVVLGMVHAPEILAEAAQQLAAAKFPKFEVVSIKPYKANAMITGIRMTPDGVNITGIPLYMIVREAFGLSGDRVLNEPDWVKSDRYDVAAKVNSADVSRLEKLEPEQRWAMMLPVLEDRCGLKFHHEMKTLEVYALVPAKGGPKLKLSQSAANGTAVKTAGQSATPPLPSSDRAGDGLSEKKLGQFFMRMSTQGMSMNAHGVPIAGLVRLLSLQLGSTVVDRTDLTGKYDFTLSWTPDRAPSGAMERPGGAPAGESPAPAEATGPSLFTALQEQLGLKLVARKEPVDVVVIDHIEKPSPN